MTEIISESYSLGVSERIRQLQDMCNMYGDFRVAIANKAPDGEVRWTKHYSVMELWGSDKGLWLLSKANNRTIFPCELVLDIDKDPTPERLDNICQQLEDLKIPYKAYFTGSRGYHIHIIDPGFLSLDAATAEKIKKVWIRTFDCDILKSSTKTMIAIENVEHWKTGIQKKLLRKYP